MVIAPDVWAMTSSATSRNLNLSSDRRKHIHADGLWIHNNNEYLTCDCKPRTRVSDFRLLFDKRLHIVKCKSARITDVEKIF